MPRRSLLFKHATLPFTPRLVSSHLTCITENVSFLPPVFNSEDLQRESQNLSNVIIALEEVPGFNPGSNLA